MAKFVKCGDYWINLDRINFVFEETSSLPSVKVFFSESEETVLPVYLACDDAELLLKAIRNNQ